MTRQFNKVLAVFVSVASVAFLGFSLAFYSGGVNWLGETRADDLNDYKFQLSSGDNPQWTVTDSRGRNVATVDKNKLPEAVIKARKDLQQKQRTESTALEQEIPTLQTRLAALQKLQTDDQAAIDRRISELEDQLQKMQDAVIKSSEDVLAKSREAQTARTRAQNRRNDVYRLQNELEVLRTDRARLVELRRVLADQLLRLNITNQTLKQRVSQLESGT